MSRAGSRPVYDVFHVSLGWCAAARSGKGVCAFVLPVRGEQLAEEEIFALTDRLLQPGAAGPRRAPSALQPLAEAAARYFDGETVRFGEFPADLSSGTAFQRRVWGMIGRIPYGQVRTYRWVGVEIGRPEAARAIGRAVGANPVPLLVPCHRVIGFRRIARRLLGGGRDEPQNENARAREGPPAPRRKRVARDGVSSFTRPSPSAPPGSSAARS